MATRWAAGPPGGDGDNEPPPGGGSGAGGQVGTAEAGGARAGPGGRLPPRGTAWLERA